MSRSTYAPKQTYTGTGALASYTFDFKIEVDTQLLVVEVSDVDVETQRVLGDDVTYLSGIVFDPVNGGGTVTLAANLATNYRLILLLANDVPTQGYEFRNKSTFTLKRFESSLDFIAGAIQRLAYRGKQAFRIHDLDDQETFDAMLPPRVDLNLETTLMINAAGTGLDYGPTKADLVATLAAAAAALVSETNAAASAAQTALDRIATAADVVTTNADVVLTNADAAQTALDRIATAADAAQTALDRIATAADAAQTALDRIATAADVVTTNADVVLTNADVVAADASAAAALVSELAAAVSAAAAAASVAELLIIFGTQTIASLGTISHSVDMRQYRRVVSSGGALSASLTPFGVVATNFKDGMEIFLIGTSDTNTVQISENDVQYGTLTNGDIILGRGQKMSLMYDATLERWLENSYF